MPILMENKLLAATEQKIESQLTPDNRANYLRVVNAGMQTAIHGGPKSILASLKQSKNPVNDCVIGAINLCLLMRKQSRGTMPMKAMVPAATTLMLKALDFAEQLGKIKVDNDVLVQAMHLFTNTIFKRMDITPQMLQHAVGKVHALTQDPVAMQKINLKSGVVAHPNAAPVGGGNGTA